MYSSHHCVYAKDDSPELDSTRFVTRTCRYTNLYYSPRDQKFHYYPSPSERDLLVTKEDLMTLERGLEVSLGNVFRKHSKKRELVPAESIWRPEVHKDKNLPDKYAVISNPSNLAFMLYQPWYSFNPGHFLWDDALSLFTMLDIFRLTGRHEDDPDITPMPFYVEMKKQDPYYRCHAGSKQSVFRDRWKTCTKLFHRMFPSVFRYETHKSGDILRTGTWLKGMSDVYGGANSHANANFEDDANATNIQDQDSENDWNQMLPDTSLVLVPTVLAGIGSHGQMACEGDCGIGRSSQLFAFRTYLLRNILWPDYESISKEKKSPAGYITFSLPSGSSRPDEVSLFENIIPVAKELYGEDKVKITDMATLTTKEESMLAMDTAVLFANHGGGSSTSIFLPWGSSVFLYAAGKCGEYWCDLGHKNHFDSVFYASNGYMRPTWIHEDERENIVRIKQILQIEYKRTIDSWTERGMH